MCIQSAVQHLASAVGAFLAAQMLSERADHSLIGMGRVVAMSGSLGALLPGLMWLVDVRVRRREEGTADAAMARAGASIPSDC
jgi:hypothetical protein